MLTACVGSPEDCQAPAEDTCTEEGGSCGDGTGPGCAPDASHIDYTKSCTPKVGASGKLGAVCCMPGAPAASDASAE